jgi:hypothetical protein
MTVDQPPTHWDAECRERIAPAVLAGLLGGGDRCGGHTAAAEEACDFADALMAELDKRAEHAERAPPSAELVPDELARAYRYILAHAPPVEDHACAQCVPGGEMVREDFVCLRHRALAHVGAAERASKDGAS